DLGTGGSRRHRGAAGALCWRRIPPRRSAGVIGAIAVAETLIAEGLTFYVVNELLAASWDETGGGSVRAITYMFIVAAAFILPRALDTLAIEGRWGYITLGVVSSVILNAVFRIEFAGDIAIWNWVWVA